jgi:hypothetical protein
MMSPSAKFHEVFQPDLGCPLTPPKIFRFSFSANQLLSHAIPRSPEGRFAIVTNVGQGLRWTPGAEDERRLADGQVVWS